MGLYQKSKKRLITYKKEYKFLKIILSGGDAQKLSKTLKNTIFANKNFLAKGLNFILSNNIKLMIRIKQTLFFLLNCSSIDCAK